VRFGSVFYPVTDIAVVIAASACVLSFTIDASQCTICRRYGDPVYVSYIFWCRWR